MKVRQLVGANAGQIVEMPLTVAQACLSNGTCALPGEPVFVKGLFVDYSDQPDNAPVAPDIRPTPVVADIVETQDVPEKVPPLPDVPAGHLDSGDEEDSADSGEKAAPTKRGRPRKSKV